MLGAILIGTYPYLAAMQSAAEIEADNLQNRERLASVLPPEVVRETVEGFELHVLCDTPSGEVFAADGGETPSISEKAVKRNEHLKIETGVELLVSVTEDFVQTATEDLLSGAHYYNLYAATAAPSLSSLLASGRLTDVTGSVHIRPEKEWFDGGIMDELSMYGKHYLISSATADARRHAAVIVYDGAMEAGLGLLPEDERSLAKIALDGDFTLEKMLTVSRGAHIPPTEGDPLLGGVDAFPGFYGFAYGDSDVFALYAGLGGDFLTDNEEQPVVTSLAALREALGTLQTLTSDPSSLADANAFAEGRTLLSVCRMSEITALRAAGTDVGILPLPKAHTEDDYRCYIDPTKTTMLAIPSGTAEQEKVEFLVARMAFLSYGYIEPVLKKQIAADDPDNQKILALVAESVSCDRSTLLGYGDIGGLLAGIVREGDGRLTLEYYNRKALYEKALSILEKRLTAEQK